MFAYRLGVTEVMELLNKTVEQFFIRASSNLTKDNTLKFLYFGVYGVLRYGNFSRRFALGQGIVWCEFSWWKREVSLPLQLEHQATADNVFEIAIGLHPVPSSANLTR